MTLLELMIALGLGASLSAAMLHMFVGNMQIQAVQARQQDLQHRAAYARLLLRSAIQEAGEPRCSADEASGNAGSRIELQVAPSLLADAMPGSTVLRLVGSDCDAPVSIYYIGFRGSDENNRPGLFRRRQLADGRYRAAEEMVEGVTTMNIISGVLVSGAIASGTNVASSTVSNSTVSESERAGSPSLRLAYLAPGQVSDWSAVFSLDLHLSLQPLATLHVVYDHAADSRDMHTAENLELRFSTSLSLNGADYQGSVYLEPAP